MFRVVICWGGLFFSDSLPSCLRFHLASLYFHSFGWTQFMYHAVRSSWALVGVASSSISEFDCLVEAFRWLYGMVGPTGTAVICIQSSARQSCPWNFQQSKRKLMQGKISKTPKWSMEHCKDSRFWEQRWRTFPILCVWGFYIQIALTLVCEAHLHLCQLSFFEVQFLQAVKAVLEFFRPREGELANGAFASFVVAFGFSGFSSPGLSIVNVRTSTPLDFLCMGFSSCPLLCLALLIACCAVTML